MSHSWTSEPDAVVVAVEMFAERQVDRPLSPAHRRRCAAGYRPPARGRRHRGRHLCDECRAGRPDRTHRRSRLTHSPARLTLRFVRSDTVDNGAHRLLLESSRSALTRSSRIVSPARPPNARHLDSSRGSPPLARHIEANRDDPRSDHTLSPTTETIRNVNASHPVPVTIREATTSSHRPTRRFEKRRHPPTDHRNDSERRRTPSGPVTNRDDPKSHRADAETNREAAD